ncbi:MAG TPA: aromatic ring-hydroxylating dioxygenase subunit alpha [Paracoccaceae bacterium]|nr:aromatic ring-hydroxylating dioxygenase subunit alpha [Paracoccaceae bacterium]
MSAAEIRTGPADIAFAEALAAVRAPIGAARGLPNALYAGGGWAVERERLFRGGWSCIGFEEDVPEPGDVRPVDHLGAPLLMARDRAGGLRVFQNVCRHRGMILVDAPRNVPGVLRCPYHSWCYSLDGKLRATPHVGGPGLNAHPAVDPAATGLIGVRSGVFLGCVFVALDAEAEPFEDFVAPLRAAWADFADRPLFHGGDDSRFALELAANWKLAVENYCESYHLPWVHPGLNAYSRLEDHYPLEGEGFAGQGTTVYAPALGGDRAFPDFPGLPSRWDRAAEYAALFPNLLLGVHRDHVFAIRLEPLGPDRLREHVSIRYAAPEAAGPDFAPPRARNAALWREVFEEDVFVVEGMQRGRGAPGFDGGVFSPVMDGPTHAFHRWVAAKLA